MAHSGYHPLKRRPRRVVFGWCTVDIILLNIVLLVIGWCTMDIILLNIVLGVWMHSGYHPLKHRPVKVVFGWRTVDIILLNIVLLG